MKRPGRRSEASLWRVSPHASCSRTSVLPRAGTLPRDRRPKVWDMAVMTPRANELSVLMRAADALLNAATDEASVLSHAVELLGEQFGYSMRYLLLYDAERDELYTGMAAGEGSMEAAVMNYRMSTELGLTGACA